MKSLMGPSGTAFQYHENLEGDVVVTPMGHPECRVPMADLLELMMVWMAEADALGDERTREAFTAAARRAKERE